MSRRKVPPVRTSFRFTRCKPHSCLGDKWSGRRAERIVFGFTHQEARDRLKRYGRRPGTHENDFVHVSWLMENQPRGWSPRHPKTPIARRIQNVVSRGLGTAPHSVRLFAAIGTYLDGLRGWDMVIGLFRGGELKAFITVDVSARPAKRNLRADFLLSARWFWDDDVIAHLAREIRRELCRRADAA